MIDKVVNTIKNTLSSDMLKSAINDIIAGGWTIFGLAIAWAVLPDGETRNTVGSILLALSVAWLVTGPLRWRD